MSISMFWNYRGDECVTPHTSYAWKFDLNRSTIKKLSPCSQSQTYSGRGNEFKAMIWGGTENGTFREILG